jgi:outer membrane lipoprotein-sorting protein
MQKTLSLSLKTLIVSLMMTSSSPALASNSKSVDKVENYLNSIKTLRANFIQIASNGEKVEGRIYIEKPNKIRMEYNSPSDILIVGNGDYIVYYDKELDQITNIDYEDIPAALILAQNVNIDNKELKVSNFYQDTGITKLSLEYTKDDLGPFTLVFSNSPFELKQWKVITPQAMEVSLSLYDTVTDGKLDSKLFEFRKNEETKKSSPRRK